MTLETLTERALLAGLSLKNQAKALAYVARVLNPVRSGQALYAQVQGTELYDVTVTCLPKVILSSCSCPLGGQCKHVYALLLKWLREPEAFAGAGEVVRPQERPLAVQPIEPPATFRPEQPPYWVAPSFAERQHGYVRILGDRLGQLRLQDLRDIARRRGWHLKGTDKAGITAQVAQAMAAPGSTLEAALALDKEHQRVLVAMALMGAGAEKDDVARVAGAWGGPSQVRPVANCMLQLCSLGLALPSAAARYDSGADFCPFAVARALLPLVHRVLLASMPRPVEDAGAARAEVRPADPFPLVRAVSEVALLLERSPVALRPPMPRPEAEAQFAGLRGWDYDPAELQRAQQERRLRPYSDLILAVPPPQPSLPGEAVERLAPVAGDEARLEFIYSLLVAVGVLQPGSPVTVWPEMKRQYLCRNEMEQRAILARTYFVMTNWSEFWELLRTPGPDALQVKRHAGYAYHNQDRLRTDLAHARLLVVRALACLPDDSWIPLDALLRLLRPVWPRFDEVVRDEPGYHGPSSTWFLARAGSDARFVPAGDDDWDLAQGRFVAQMLAGPLHWLGLADLRYTGGRLQAFRLHGLADLFWDRVAAPPTPGAAAPTMPADAAPVTVRGTRIAVCPAAVSAQAHGLLERIARLEEAGAGRFEYELDALTTYRAFEAGATLGEIEDGWRQLLSVAMPEAIHAQLERWWAAYGRVRIYQDLTVVELADDYALAEMKAVTSLAQHIVAEISPRLVIVDEAAVSTLVAELEKAGYTPKQTDQV